MRTDITAAGMTVSEEEIALLRAGDPGARSRLADDFKRASARVETAGDMALSEKLREFSVMLTE